MASAGRLPQAHACPLFPSSSQAMKEYGMILADNGSNWFVSGAPSPSWSNAELHKLRRVPGSAFEVVDGTKLGP